MTAERNTLAEEVNMLRQKLREGGIPLQPKMQQKTTAWLLYNKTRLMHLLQLVVLLAYFLWEDHVWRMHCK